MKIRIAILTLFVALFSTIAWAQGASDICTALPLGNSCWLSARRASNHLEAKILGVNSSDQTQLLAPSFGDGADSGSSCVGGGGSPVTGQGGFLCTYGNEHANQGRAVLHCGDHASARIEIKTASTGQSIAIGNDSDGTNWDWAGGRTLAAQGTSSRVDLTAGKLELPASTTIPATCTQGELYHDTDSNDCANTGGGDGALCICKTTNTWALVANM